CFKTEFRQLPLADCPPPALRALIHPSATSIITLIIRRLVVSVFVEIDVAIVLAHVDLELLGGSSALPPVIVVLHAVEAFAHAERHAATKEHRVPQISGSKTKQDHTELQSKV